jgi:hypothetical protein
VCAVLLVILSALAQVPVPEQVRVPEQVQV